MYLVLKFIKNLHAIFKSNIINTIRNTVIRRTHNLMGSFTSPLILRSLLFKKINTLNFNYLQKAVVIKVLH
jgi:hypothetical protein